MVPQALEDELYDRLVEYYRDDPNVEVIIDRRKQGGDPTSPELADRRRRRRAYGSFPSIDSPA